MHSRLMRSNTGSTQTQALLRTSDTYCAASITRRLVCICDLKSEYTVLLRHVTKPIASFSPAEAYSS